MVLFLGSRNLARKVEREESEENRERGRGMGGERERLGQRDVSGCPYF